ncbi:DNA-3-methyladenine glycosylase family protein [Runella slithyformis]|uniref:DNA-3-methyladenine glycosylase II n=1 Tax=Runella slithyformis (strain ATCC 29530 / DSM 19594 / LMG 11500 / NCIMB 11436 / LSU 4) TaxID=761193 RepID=A0A7U3ZNC9_RUNSL|nr:DNA-3-methyladenine glycosylase [Runella slithyformis]AEI50374.1 HhH-GPD family protein [Runella slithyformis DSM 19594]
MIAETYLASNDAIMASIIETTPMFKKVDWNHDVYLALLESIVSQQISVKAADSIFTRFRALFDDAYPHPESLLSKTAEELRSAGLSLQKIKYLQNVALFAIENGIDYEKLQKLTDEEIVRYLIPIKGVGRWTVEMLLMFVMDRPDVFPIDDLVIRQKMVRAYNLTETGRALYKELHVIAENWRPYRTMACHYLWRWKPEL